MANKKNGEPRKSTTGGYGKREVDQSTWRVKLQKGRIKFDDKMKQVFLKHFADTNRMMESADMAGVNYNTVVAHIDNDPEFSEAFHDAKQVYRDRCLKQAQKLMFEGVEEPIIGGKDRDTVVATKIRYSEPLLMMELKKVDPEYKERQEVDNRHSGGVLLAPAGESPEDWVKNAQEENKFLTEPDKTLK